MTSFERPVREPMPAVSASSASHAPRLTADWVFGYGSLLWNPGFAFSDAHLGRVHGYHRAFCIRSTRYRGTPARPGVVLGLDRGGSCIGMAFRLHPELRAQAIEALYEREMTGGVYVPRILAIALADEQRVTALTFVANRDSASYERLNEGQIVERLSSSCGQRGENREYAIRTWHSLISHGVHCPHLGRIGRRLLALDSECAPTAPTEP